MVRPIRPVSCWTRPCKTVSRVIGEKPSDGPVSTSTYTESLKRSPRHHRWWERARWPHPPIHPALPEIPLLAWLLKSSGYATELCVDCLCAIQRTSLRTNDCAVESVSSRVSRGAGAARYSTEKYENGCIHDSAECSLNSRHSKPMHNDCIEIDNCLLYDHGRVSLGSLRGVFSRVVYLFTDWLGFRFFFMFYSAQFRLSVALLQFTVTVVM